jgi:hypothetical protein
MVMPLARQALVAVVMLVVGACTQPAVSPEKHYNLSLVSWRAKDGTWMFELGVFKLARPKTKADLRDLEYFIERPPYPPDRFERFRETLNYYDYHHTIYWYDIPGTRLRVPPPGILGQIQRIAAEHRIELKISAAPETI